MNSGEDPSGLTQEVLPSLDPLIDRDSALAIQVIPIVAMRHASRVLPMLAWDGHVSFWKKESGDNRVKYLAAFISVVEILYALREGDLHRILANNQSLAHLGLSMVREAREYAYESVYPSPDIKDSAYRAFGIAERFEGALLTITRAYGLTKEMDSHFAAKQASYALRESSGAVRSVPPIGHDIFTALKRDIEDVLYLSSESISDFSNSPLWHEIPRWYLESVNKIINVVDSLDRRKDQEHEWETIDFGVRFLKKQAVPPSSSSKRTQASGIFQPEKPSMVDSLNRESLAKALAKNLVHEKNRDSRTIGLLGDWGSGKTTFVNMLKNELIKSDSVQPFIFGDFNAWAYEHTDNIQAGIAQELIKALTSSSDFSNQPAASEKGESAEDLVMPPSGVWSSFKSFMGTSVDYLFMNLSWTIVFDLARKAPKKFQVMARGISDAILYFFKIAKRHLTDINTLRILAYLLFFSIPWAYSFLSGFLDFSFELSFSGQMKSMWAACFFALGVCNVVTNKASFLRRWISSGAASFVGRLKRVPLWSGLTLGWALERLKLTALFSVKAHPFQLIKITFLVLLAIAPLISGFLENHHAAKWLWVIGFGAIWFREIGKIVMNPLAKELMTYLRLPSYAKHLGEIPVMRENIHLLCKLRLREKNEKTPRLLFIVDDLDRCSHDSIVKVLESIRLVLELENVVVIIAIDQHIALAALSNHFKEFSPHHKLKNSHAIAREYLSKVINLPVVLTEPSYADVKNYMDKIWSELPDISESEDINQVPGGAAIVEDVNLGSETYEQRSDANEGEIGSNNPQSKLNPIETISREKRDSFIRWVKYFKLTNPRQLKRLNNSYDLMRSYFDPLDQETVSFSLPDEKSLTVYPMLLTLILMEYLNSLEDLSVRLKLWKKLFSSSNDEVVFNNPNITQVDPSLFDKSLIDAEFIRAYRQLLQLKDYSDLEDKVKAFVLPAMT